MPESCHKHGGPYLELVFSPATPLRGPHKERQVFHPETGHSPDQGHWVAEVFRHVPPGLRRCRRIDPTVSFVFFLCFFGWDTVKDQKNGPLAGFFPANHDLKKNRLGGCFPSKHGDVVTLRWIPAWYQQPIPMSNHHGLGRGRRH